MANPVTWFELDGPHPEQAAAFYADLFGWSMQAIPDQNYTIVGTHAGSGINGGISKTSEGEEPYQVFYVENPDIQALLDKAGSMGAKTVIPVTVVPDMVTFARFTDPFGNLIGLAQGDGSSNVEAGDNPPVDWFDFSCGEPHRAWDFYRELFGWKIQDPGAQGIVYGMVDTGGGIRGGIGGSPDGRPHVNLYASVDDLQKYLEQAETLGAKTVMPPSPVDEHTSIALFADPQGTTFGMYSTTP